MEFTLHINNQVINNLNLGESSDNCLDWEKDIYSFLTEWSNDEDFVIVHTSGSTGTPKPIQLLKSDMLASAKLTLEHFELQESQTALLCLPTKYIAGKMMLVRAIIGNLQLISLPPSSCPNIKAYTNIDFAAMTPMQVKSILKQDKEALNNLQQLIIGGAPVDHILERDLQATSAACYSTFGMTETVTHIAVKRLNGIDKSKHYTALKNVSFSVGNEDNLIIKAPHLSTSTIETSDKVQLISNQDFIHIGRTNNTINSGGVKLQPEQIEAKVKNLLLDHRFFFDSQPNKLLGEELILIVESAKTIANLKEQLKEILSAFEVPKNIYFTPTFIETETGKVNRNKTKNLAIT